MQTFVTEPIGIMCVVSIMVAMSLYVQKYKVFRYLGPAMTCIVVGIILSNMNIMPHEHSTYGIFFTYGIPLTMTMFLLSVDFKEWIKLAKAPLISMFLACISVFIMAIISGILFAHKIDEGWKIAGMFVGTYTGGSSNLTAIGTGLDASPTAFAAANAADYVIGIPVMLLLFALPNIFQRNRTINKIWPYSLDDNMLIDESQGSFYDKKEWSVIDLAILFMLGFIVNAIATYVSGFFVSTIAGAVRIIAITTIALILAQFGFAKKIKGGQELGLFISLYYLAAIGLAIDVNQFLNSAPLITAMCAVTSIGALLLHLILTRIFKIPYQYVITSISASIVDGPTAALIVSSANWTALIGTGIVLGAIGNAVGNYLGLGVAYLIKAIHGL